MIIEKIIKTKRVVTCNVCMGTGKLLPVSYMLNGLRIDKELNCKHCNGSGLIGLK